MGRSSKVITGQNRRGDMLRSRGTSASLPDSADTLLQELQVHQIELEIQNDALREAQAALQASHERYVSLFDFAPMAYLTLATDGRMTEANRAAIKTLGAPLADLLQTPFDLFVARPDLGRWKQHAEAVLRGQPNTVLELQLTLVNVQGQAFPAQLQSMLIEDPEKVRAMRIALVDTTERSRIEAEIHRMAYFDTLTQLPNRRLLQDRLAHALATAARTGLYGAILFLDLDNFKALNDTLGHGAGDHLLSEVARRLRSSLREGDTVARMGGDEFVMILEALGTTAEGAAILARQVGEKLNQTIAHRLVCGDHEFSCTASIGARLFGTGESVEELLKHADLALYQAKSAGRNRVRFFDATMQAALDERRRLENALEHALERNQLALHYQPQLNVAHKVIGAEALLRWHHPERGLIGPDSFISLAEQSELVLPIEHWVLNTACIQLESWSRSTRTRALTLSINIGARQFRQPGFADRLRHSLAAHRVDPRRLTLEVAESVLIEDIGESVATLKAIKRIGVCLSVDRFGASFSSLSQLPRCEIDQIKIEKAFVINLVDQGHEGMIIATIAAMSHTLGLGIVAVGVETEQQRAFLERHRCDAYQGYLHSAPLILEQFSRYSEVATGRRTEFASVQSRLADSLNMNPPVPPRGCG